MEFLSTTALANELDMESSELFHKLKSLGWIERMNEKWILTDSGKKIGGQVRNSANFGDYVVWPKSILAESELLRKQVRLLNATDIGKHYSVSSQRLNLILAELGWIEKDVAGWAVTKIGKAVGGRQFEHDSGALFAKWPEDILKNSSLLSATSNLNPTTNQEPTNSNYSQQNNLIDDFRLKYEANFRAKDGHYVRSRAELLIDNALYEYGLIHAYEKKLSVEEELITDFYLPQSKVYIEYWGLENDPAYQKRKENKIGIYKKYELNLIELNDADISNLDDFLPKKLLKFGIKVY